MVVYIFFISDKDDKKVFFEKSFLIVNVKLDVVFGILFLINNNTDINFKA